MIFWPKMYTDNLNCISLKDFDTFMYIQNYIVIEDIFVVIAFKILEKQTIKLTKNGENFKFKNYRRKINLSFMNYVDFESISKR